MKSIVYENQRFCTTCQSIIKFNSNGEAFCNCDSIPIVINPTKWILCRVHIEFPNHPTTYVEAYDLSEKYEIRKDK